MTTPPDFFEEKTVAAPAAPPGQWHFVTNNMNLQFMLAAGMIMPPAGFMDKHYKDTLSDFPGFIPLFLNSVPKAALEAAASERSHLIPCIAKVDLGEFKGPARAVDLQGNLHEVSFPDALIANLHFLLVPAPLPIGSVKEVWFASGDDKKRFEQGARDFNNVSLEGLLSKVNASSFKKATAEPWPPRTAVPEIETALAAPLAAGAMMAMLFHLARKSETGLQFLKRAFEPHDEVFGSGTHPILAATNQWLILGKAPASDEASVRLFWGLVDQLAENSLAANKNQPLDVALAYLESQRDQHEDDRFRQAGAKLIKDLQGLVRFSDETVTEVLEQHSKPFARALILFFLRETLTELLDYRSPLLNEQDYLAAAILFSARQGWMGVSTDLREPPQLRSAISHRMAAMAHRLAQTGVDLGNPPPRPQPLNELFSPGPKGWTKNQKEAAVELAKACKWDCLQTRVTLGKGDYRLSVDGSGMHLLIDGLAKAVVEEVDQSVFFALLNREAISQKLERRIRAELKG
ncbi:hypothetical protein CKO15_08800 [Halorhodospira abdelmalekii]|uniref:hypothetical protein n=1 Tax=Halorhodospira abdelmalekii TaxID=421629 RepID=UPI001907A80A|nr:hypothetical protein [Halorhodospira abdelmalekii]MBK1735379.1 hypothetical protein [Halorhodospira abdelmalekii]